jgi:hypothetical protein
MKKPYQIEAQRAIFKQLDAMAADEILRCR